MTDCDVAAWFWRAGAGSGAACVVHGRAMHASSCVLQSWVIQWRPGCCTPAEIHEQSA